MILIMQSPLLPCHVVSLSSKYRRRPILEPSVYSIIISYVRPLC
jgi:hypothetical protein